MSRWKAIAKMIEDEGKSEARLKPRFIARGMKCAHQGQVMDFSASGLRIQYKKKPCYEIGAHLEIALESEAGVHRGLVQVMRIEKLGFRKFEVGFQFIEEDAAKRMQLFKCGYNALDDGGWTAA